MGQHLLFEINSNHFTFVVKDVNSIITKKSSEIRHVPDMPSFIKGLTQLREKTIAIIDLSNLFFSKKNESQEYTIIIINYKNDLFGIIVDKVHNIKNIEDTEIQDSFFVKDFNKYIRGVYNEGETMWLIIDIEILMSIRKMEEISHDN